jgi:hypothetical protein
LRAVQVLGADTASCSSDEDQEAIIHRFLTSLRNEPAARSAVIVLIVERNFGGSVLASRIGNIASSFSPIVLMTQDSAATAGMQRAGVITSKPVKERMRVDLSRLLRTDKFKISRSFFSNLAETKGEMCKQLMDYRMEFTPATMSGRPAKIVYSGKGHGKNDDLAIVVQLLCFWPATYFTDPVNSCIRLGTGRRNK